MVELAERKTPLLRWRGALLKLECLRPAGGFDDRAVAIFPTLAPGTEAALAATGPGALAAAAWARRRRVRLRIALHGAVTHEMRETLRLWGVTFDHFTAREEALRRAREMAPEVLPPLDGPKASAELARTLGAELLEDVAAAPATIIAPAGAVSALLGAFQALRSRWPAVGALALTAADEELPELPRNVELPGIATRAISFAQASAARAELARTSGVLASHAAAAAAVAAGDSGVAIVTSAGEREFSLERVA